MRSNCSLLWAGAAAAALLTGCNRESTPNSPPQPPAGEKAHDHDHGAHGPHGGALVELGDDEYHAEVLCDAAAGDVTVYILDGSAKSPVSIDAPEVVINFVRGGEPAERRIPAAPQEGDPPGKSSRFVSSKDPDFVRAMKAPDAKPRLRATIGGTPFNGPIELEHEHGDEK